MAIDDRFRAQVDLLLRTIPFIAKEKCFALKGGTAINLFVRDLLTPVTVFDGDLQAEQSRSLKATGVAPSPIANAGAM